MTAILCMAVIYMYRVCLSVYLCMYLFLLITGFQFQIQLCTVQAANATCTVLHYKLGHENLMLQNVEVYSSL